MESKESVLLRVQKRTIKKLKQELEERPSIADMKFLQNSRCNSCRMVQIQEVCKECKKTPRLLKWRNV